MKKKKIISLKQIFRGIIMGLGIFTLFGIFGIIGLYASGSEWLTRVTTETKLTSTLWNNTMTEIEDKFDSKVSLTEDQTISGKKTFSSTISGVTPVDSSDLSTKGYTDTKYNDSISHTNTKYNQSISYTNTKVSGTLGKVCVTRSSIEGNTWAVCPSSHPYWLIGFSGISWASPEHNAWAGNEVWICCR